ncbi:MAG: CD3072 family TudS-related putative desulfidase [Candidatus Glassbacteria bacterium]
MRILDHLNRRKFLAGISCLTGAAAWLRNEPLFAGRFEKNKSDERLTERFPSFQDARSKKVIFVAHCFLNQNARCNGSAETPSAIPAIPELLIHRKIGIIQMPCPELGCLGLGREGLIYDQLSTHGNRRYLRLLAQDVMYQTRQYLRHGFRVLGILGIDCSPSCGVNCYADNGAKPGKGAFMEELSDELKNEGLEMPLIGVADAETGKAVESIIKLDS